MTLIIENLTPTRCLWWVALGTHKHLAKPSEAEGRLEKEQGHQISLLHLEQMTSRQTREGVTLCSGSEGTLLICKDTCAPFPHLRSNWASNRREEPQGKAAPDLPPFTLNHGLCRWSQPDWQDITFLSANSSVPTTAGVARKSQFSSTFFPYFFPFPSLPISLHPCFIQTFIE